jgi:YfiH family protein
VAGFSDRSIDRPTFLARFPSRLTTVEAEQVHGASVASVDRSDPAERLVAGCDALLTSAAGVALLVQTADCLPVFFSDPSRDVVGIAHAGWRGLAAELPVRLVAAFRHRYRSRAEDLRVAIGPAIRACCYDVGPELSAVFSPFVQSSGDRLTCDLIGVLKHQLQRCGVRPERVLDCQRCTGCEPDLWFSLRREGPSTGRLLSAIMLRP